MWQAFSYLVQGASYKSVDTFPASLKCQIVFWTFFFILKNWVCNAISQHRINQLTKCCVRFCRNLELFLTRKCQNVFHNFSLFIMSRDTVVRRPRCHVQYTGHWHLKFSVCIIKIFLRISRIVQANIYIGISFKWTPLVQKKCPSYRGVRFCFKE